MKKLLFLLLVLITAFPVAAQITTIPQYPTDGVEITLTFDATGTGLENYNGDVYTHTGVILEGATSWSHVIGSWGNNTTQPKLTSLGNHLYRLVITPNLRQFYDVGANEVVAQLAFVFRSDDGNMQSGDLLVNIFGSDLQLIITEPAQAQIFATEGDIIPVDAVSAQADSMFLMVNEVEMLAVAATEINYQLVAENLSGFWQEVIVTVTAKNQTGTISESFAYVILPQPTVEELPADVVDGINYISSSSVILSLYAPGKENVFVIGDFNNWQVSQDGYTNITPDGNNFWLLIDGLTPGQQYVFQYLVDASIRIGDPYAEQVSDPWNDSYISESTYPGLIDYPAGQTEGIATVLQTEQQSYSWQTENFTPPAVTDMIVYELLVRDFTEHHTFQSVIDTLGYLQRLGVNVIELMPVNEFEGNISWGYNPNYYFAVDKYYGPKNTLKAFIDTCHARGFAVVIDMVLNHSFGTSPMVMLYWDEQNNRPAADNPWYNQVPKHDFNVGFDFNHESQQTRQFVKRVNDFWLTEYRVDGFRFDLSKGFTQKNTLGNTNQWGQYDQSRIDIWNDYSDAIFETNPQAYVILEHFAENSEEKVLSANDMMVWGNSNYNYNEGTMGYTENGKSDFGWISYQERDFQAPHVVGYMESHDEERLQFRNISYGNSLSGYNIQDSATGLARLELAATFFYTIPGPKMIWQFGELGYDYSIEYNGRTGPKPIRWDYTNNWQRMYLYHVHAALAKLKKELPVFATPDFTLDVHNAQKSIVLRGDTLDVVVVGNFGMTAGNNTPAWTETGTWYEFFTREMLQVTSLNQAINLQRGEYRLYSTKPIDKPQWLNTTVEELGNPSHQSQLETYPNPSAGKVHINLQLPDNASVIVSVYDQVGRKVSEQNQIIQKGNSDIPINEDGELKPGIYFVTITNGNQHYNTKFIIH
ncbi:MAG: T9SS type A sorting domain-containing protein [Clostridia bacterium]|nr:T9SS type A sorting domain-containing protein [Clostridia bacterium]